MIDRKPAKAHVMRFSGKPGFPQADEALEALIDAMQRAPRDEAHAAAVADWLETELHFCPEPSEVWARARETAERREIGCDACGHTGFAEVEIRGVKAVRPCVCRQKPGAESQQRRGALRPLKEIKAG